MLLSDTPAAAVPRGNIAVAIRALPTTLVVAFAAATAWSDRGSIAGRNWLPIALLTALVAAAVCFSGSAVRPIRPLLGAAAALFGLAAWTAASIAWSASPALGRDEALLTVLFVLALAVPALTLRNEAERTAATAATAAIVGGIAVALAIKLTRASSPDIVYVDGRLDFPISYPNAQAALLLVAFWPAVALAARRRLPLAVRALALGAAAAVLGGWVMAQSKGGAVGLAVSAIVVFAVSRERLRLFWPTLLAALPVAAFFQPLTAPYRTPVPSAQLTAIRHAGWYELAVVAIGLVLGASYALADRRLAFAERTRAAAGAIVATALLAAACAGFASFFTTVDHPVRWAHDRWESFKRLPGHEKSTHLLSLGSNRYDFWRVALSEFRHHPIAGIGARGFRDAYIQHRKSSETPARAHSFELDALAETGLIGFALLVGAFGLLLAAILPRARDDLLRVGVAGAGIYFVVHASVDWIWTFPAIGLPLFVLLGTGLADDRRPRLPTRAGLAAGAAVVVVAAIGFLPPWLASRYTTRALEKGSVADIDSARSLDPLSTEPLLARWALATTPAEGVAPLREAVRMEPRSPDLWFQLGRQYLLAGDRVPARRALARALELAPGEVLIEETLRRAGG
jgi:hypothetical protein